MEELPRSLVGRRAPAMLAALAVSAALPLEAAAQAPDVDPFHWAYAPMFGSGDYRLDDGTEAHVYRGAFAVRLRETPETFSSGVGIRLLLPVTVGVQNLDDADLPPGRSSNELEQAGVLPGVQLEFPAGEHWRLRTSVQLGVARELEAAERSARLGAVGVRSKISFPGAPGHLALINGLLWAGIDPDDDARHALLRLTNALEFSVPVPGWKFRGSTMRLIPHVLGDWYYRPPPALGFGDDELAKLDTEWQVGVAAGRSEGFKIAFFRFDAVGVAYRFSDQSAGIRFYLNSVF